MVMMVMVVGVMVMMVFVMVMVMVVKVMVMVVKVMVLGEGGEGDGDGGEGDGDGDGDGLIVRDVVCSSLLLGRRRLCARQRGGRRGRGSERSGCRVQAPAPRVLQPAVTAQGEAAADRVGDG